MTRHTKEPEKYILDTDLNSAEHSTNDTRKVDDDFGGAESPPMVETLGRSDQITNSMNDHSRKSRIRDVEEEGRKGVDREENDESGDETSEGSSDTSLRLDGGARE